MCITTRAIGTGRCTPSKRAHVGHFSKGRIVQVGTRHIGVLHVVKYAVLQIGTCHIHNPIRRR